MVVSRPIEFRLVNWGQQIAFLIMAVAAIAGTVHAQTEIVDDHPASAIQPESATRRTAQYELIRSRVAEESNSVEIQIRLGPTQSSDGKIVKLAITMHLGDGLHTFPITFGGQGGAPTRINLKTNHGLRSTGKGFIPDRTSEDVIEAGLPLEIYTDRVTWTEEFEVEPGRKPFDYGIDGSIRYQVCGHGKCVTRLLPFAVGVTNDDLLPAETVPYFVEPAAAISAKQIHSEGLGLFLIAAVGAGLLALLTPYVFPMIPITVSFFLKQSEIQRKPPLRLALVFAAAMVLSFAVIGVGVSALFGAQKPNQLANNWVLNLFLASLFFAFALNMLGMFEIRLPSWLLALSSTRGQAGGYAGAVFMAVTFVLTSFSCTFAFVGSLLAASAKGDYYWPTLGMLAFGATFAAPFLLLALMPGLLKSIPKSGGWMNSVKVVMGFVEAAAAVKYISIVDQQLNSVPLLFDFTNVMALWAVLAICTGLYLLGQFHLSHDSPVQGLSPVRVWIAIAFLLAGTLFGVGLVQPQRDAWLLDQLVAMAPARFDNDEFELDFDRGIVDATEHNQPLFVDFTGVNCVNCRLMEKRMAKHQNHRRLQKFSLVQLYTDQVPLPEDRAEADRLLARNVSLQSDWFKDLSLPAYVIATPDGKTILASYVGLERRTGDFARFLDKGMEKWQSMQSRQ